MKEFLSIKELATRWGVKERTISELKDAENDPLPHYRFKGSIRFKIADVETYEQKHRKPEDK